MQEMKPSPFVANNGEGVARVIAEDGKYAFFVESTVLEYNLERKCQLAQVGPPLDSKGYAVALRKGSFIYSFFA
jgi:ionotropic glutamate receptor